VRGARHGSDRAGDLDHPTVERRPLMRALIPDSQDVITHGHKQDGKFGYVNNDSSALD
jgi:hypothetical protein